MKANPRNIGTSRLAISTIAFRSLTMSKLGEAPAAAAGATAPVPQPQVDCATGSIVPQAHAAWVTTGACASAVPQAHPPLPAIARVNLGSRLGALNTGASAMAALAAGACA